MRTRRGAVAFYERTLGRPLKREVFGGMPHAVFPSKCPAGSTSSVAGAIVADGPHLTPGTAGTVVYLDCPDGVAAVLREVVAEVERELAVDGDLAAAGLAVLRALKHKSGKGVWSEPALLDLLPAPHYEPLQRTFDLLIPDDSALAAYVISDDRRAVLASIIAVKRKGDIDLVTTHAAIADLVPEAALARDWATAHKRVTRAIGERLARPALAVFLERATIDQLIVGPPDTFGREVNAKRIVLDPAPAWLLGLLGSATVAAMAQRGASALAALLPQATRARATELADRARTAMRESGAHPFALLGFDPIALLLAVRTYYRPRAGSRRTAARSAPPGRRCRWRRPRPRPRARPDRHRPPPARSAGDRAAAAAPAGRSRRASGADRCR